MSNTPNEENGTYSPKDASEVGYGKPPTASRFKPGQSGNPKGRKTGSRNLTTYLREELNTRVTVTKDGKRCTLPKVALIAKQLVTAAIKGNHRSIELLVKLMAAMGEDAGKAQLSPVMTEADREVLLSYLASIAKTADGTGNGGDHDAID